MARVVRQLGQVDGRSLNMRGSLQRILTDLYAFIATAMAGGITIASGFIRHVAQADPGSA